MNVLDGLNDLDVLPLSFGVVTEREEDCFLMFGCSNKMLMSCCECREMVRPNSVERFI